VTNAPMMTPVLYLKGSVVETLGRDDVATVSSPWMKGVRRVRVVVKMQKNLVRVWNGEEEVAAPMCDVCLM